MHNLLSFSLFFILSFQFLLQFLFNREKYTVSYSDKRSFGAVCRRMLFMEISLASICVEKQFNRWRGLFALAQSIWWDMLAIGVSGRDTRSGSWNFIFRRRKYLFEAVTQYFFFLFLFSYWERKRKNYSKLIILQIFDPNPRSQLENSRRVISTWS